MEKYIVKAFDEKQEVKVEATYMAKDGDSAIEMFEEEYGDMVEGLMIIAGTQEAWDA